MSSSAPFIVVNNEFNRHITQHNTTQHNTMKLYQKITQLLQNQNQNQQEINQLCKEYINNKTRLNFVQSSIIYPECLVFSVASYPSYTLHVVPSLLNYIKLTMVCIQSPPTQIKEIMIKTLHTILIQEIKE